MIDNTFTSISTIKEDNNFQNNQQPSLIEQNIKNNTIDKFDFEKSIEISNIELKNEETNKNKINEDSNFSMDFSLNSSQIKNNNNNKTIKNKPLIKLKKEDLNHIPLPIFSCIYCSNEYIAFNHLSNEIISNKYCLQTSIFDLKQLDLLISTNNNKLDNNNKLLNIIIKNYEYLQKLYNNYNIKEYFKINNYRKKCVQNEYIIQTYFKNKFESYIVLKKKKDSNFKEINTINKITTDSINNKCIYTINYKRLNNNDNGQCPIQTQVEKNNHINQSNLSFVYINSINNDIGIIKKDNDLHRSENKDNNIEKIEKDNDIEDKTNIIDFLEENDLKRKISINDIEWESNFYDIYNPIINDNILNHSFIKDEYELIKNKRNKFKSLYNMINNIRKMNSTKYCYINAENNINTINNSLENSKQNKKLTFFNNSKSLASTNTSSNIILKNSIGDKDTKYLPLFSKGNKIIKNLNNTSPINEKNEIDNNISLYLFNNKNEKNFNSCYRTPSFTKTRIIDLYSNSDKKVNINNNRRIIDFKNINKKLLFNYTTNIKKEIYSNNNRNLIFQSPNYTNKGNNNIIENKNLFSFLNMNSIGYEIPNKYYKYKLLLDKSNNIENQFNKTLFNKTSYNINKDNKKNNKFNIIFKYKNNYEYCPVKSQIDNNRQFSILHNINIINLKQLNNISCIRKEIMEKKNIKFNNIYKNNKSKKKVNISIPEKLFSDNNKHNKIKNKEINKSSINRKNKNKNKIIFNLKNKNN